MRTARTFRAPGCLGKALLAGVALGVAVVGPIKSAAGTPWPRHVIDVSSVGADGVRLGDADGDGRPDITTGWEEGGQVRVYFNPGPARCREPWPAVTVGAAPSVEDAVFADLDGDGTLEVVSCLEGNARRVQVHWATPQPPGAPPVRRRAALLDPAAWRTDILPVTAGAARWMFCAPMQIDGRHGVDLLVGSKGSRGSVSWLEAPADPHNLAGWKLHRLRDAGWIMSLRVADLDHDGDPDVLVSDRKDARRGVFWLENPAPTQAAAGALWREHSVLASPTDVMFVDLVPRGRGWRLAAALKPRRLVVCEVTAAGEGPWKVVAERAIPPAFGTGKAVCLARLAPGWPPGLLFTCEGAVGELSGMGWFPATDAGFTPAVDLGGAPGVKFDRIELLDLDADGDLDVITCEERDNLGVIWYENPAR